MEFKTMCGMILKIDPLSQESISAAKKIAPGQGVGPVVARGILKMLVTGVVQPSQLPAEYAHLSVFVPK